MAKSDNPFLTYLDNHPGCDAAALKQLFRLLAKRTHPDLGAENEADFVRLQDAYNEAIAELIRRGENSRGSASGWARRARQFVSPGRTSTGSQKSGGSDTHEVWLPSTPRERVFHFIYRYKAHLRSISLDPGQVPPACHRAFENALEAADAYTDECRYALRLFDEQFHANRSEVARYPDVATKYRCLLNALGSFFDFCLTPNNINERIAKSYLSELKPVTDYNPEASPEMRTNRSAAARSAMYRMRTWLESELVRGPCRVL